jgi:pyruvate formate lyase activating enzyme
MRKTTRRDFLNTCAACVFLAGIPDLNKISGNIKNLLNYDMVNPYPASYYTKIDSTTTKCLLCPNGCIRKPGNRGKCNARENIDGEYYSLVYNTPCLIHLDKIEKLPIYHLSPGVNVFSIATAGCNLTCKYCQNWQFSQKSPYETRNYSITPKEIIQKAKQSNCKVIAFFYTEPVIYFEYMRDIAKLAKAEKMKTIMVSAGYINDEPLKEIIPLLDAVTFGLKGFSEKYYNNVIGGSLEPVLNTMKLLEKYNIWYEIVNLIVPTLNDNPVDIKNMCEWITKNLSRERPVHFTRFVPEFQLRDLPFTPQKTLEQARNIAFNSGLAYVYTGNMPGHEGNNTYCPECKSLLIQRIGVNLKNNYLKNGKCPKCGKEQYGKWNT